MTLAREGGLDTAYVPATDPHEATLRDGVRTKPVLTLGVLLAHLPGGPASAVSCRPSRIVPGQLLYSAGWVNDYNCPSA